MPISNSKINENKGQGSLDALSSRVKGVVDAIVTAQKDLAVLTKELAAGKSVGGFKLKAAKARLADLKASFLRDFMLCYPNFSEAAVKRALSKAESENAKAAMRGKNKNDSTPTLNFGGSDFAQDADKNSQQSPSYLLKGAEVKIDNILIYQEVESKRGSTGSTCDSIGRGSDSASRSFFRNLDSTSSLDQASLDQSAPLDQIAVSLNLTKVGSKPEAKIIKKYPYIFVTDFARVYAYERATGDFISLEFKDLWREADFFTSLTGVRKVILGLSDNKADLKAAEQIGKLYKALINCNEVASGLSHHDVNVFLTRSLFCFFAEDTGIFSLKIASQRR